MTNIDKILGLTLLSMFGFRMYTEFRSQDDDVSKSIVKASLAVPSLDRSKALGGKKELGGKDLKQTSKTESLPPKKRAGDQLQKGLDLFRSKEYKRSIKWLKLASQGGSMEATSKLAFIYENGLGLVDENLEFATELYEKAANAGDPDSMYSLGHLLLMRQELTEEHMRSAQKWLEKSASIGHAEAADSVAKLYEADQQYSLALKWYRMAAKNGHPQGLKNIASIERVINSQKKPK